MAGDNGDELIAVLEHYKHKDKNKYKAACFLIGNMSYHSTDECLELDSGYLKHFLKVDSLYEQIFGNIPWAEAVAYEPSEYMQLFEQLGGAYDLLPDATLQKGKDDLLALTADFLIDNIDEAFDVWKNNPLLTRMNFDDFKEFILPYRSSTEDLAYKRSAIRKIAEKRLLIEGCGSIQLVLEKYRVYVQKQRWMNQFATSQKKNGLFIPFQQKLAMNCEPLTVWTTNFFRSCGIPVVFEYTAQYRDRASKHFWCASPDSLGIVKPYTVPNNNLMQDWDVSIKKATKVYRRNFAANRKSPYFLKNPDEYIPSELSSPLISDQTYRYGRTVTLRLPFDEKTGNRLAYLAQFNRSKEFAPVAWGIIDPKNKEVVFEQVPVNTLFFPIYYVEDVFKIFGLPFSINAPPGVESLPAPMTTMNYPPPMDVSVRNNKFVYSSHRSRKVEGLEYFTVSCDENSTQQLMISRKFPNKPNLDIHRNEKLGSYFLGYNSQAETPDTLYVIRSAPGSYYEEVAFSRPQKYLRYRYELANKGKTQIGEIAFLGPYTESSACFAPDPSTCICSGRHDPKLQQRTV